MAKRKKNISDVYPNRVEKQKIWRQIRQVVRLFWKNLQNKIRTFDCGKISLKNEMIKLLAKFEKVCEKCWAKSKFICGFQQKIFQSGSKTVIAIAIFLLSYYSIGGYLAENMDVNTEYKFAAEDSPLFETAESMSFLLKREIDDKMWTPNLPIIFPAYVLDNMPNFQMGIVAAVKDVADDIRSFSQNTPAQQKDIKQAVKLLNYSPKIWLMSRSGKFSLAPSSNTQYRKAAHLLQQYRKDGVFMANADEVYVILQQVSKKLFKMSDKNAEQQREHSKDWFDRYSDDLFYYNRGYAFAMWQMSKVLSVDYKSILVQKKAYEDWTYYLSSLRQAAEFKPKIVRNGEADALFAANHLLTQNYFLVRAAAAAERVANKLLKE